MTTTPPPFDERVSAYLDGEATADEVARVESTPELMAEVERLQSITNRLSTGPEIAPAPPAQKEAHLAAALAAFDVGVASPASATSAAAEPEVDDSEPRRTPASTTRAASASTELASTQLESTDSVVSLGERRSSRSWPNGRVLGIAAALVLFVLGAAALISFNGGSGSRFETADTATVDSASDASDASSDDDADAADTEEAMTEAFDEESWLENAPAAEAAMEEEAMEEEEAMDEGAIEDKVSEDDAMAEDDTAGDAAGALADEPAASSADASNLDMRMYAFATDLSPSEGEALWIGPASSSDQIGPLFDQRASTVLPTIRTRCQMEILELDSSAAPTLIGLTSLDDTSIEIHQVAGADTAFLVDSRLCTIIEEIPAPS